jgi:predicted nucleic acid-binding protein
LTVYLLDVNVLIALLVPAHSAALPASQWFDGIRDDGWATCPIVENGVIRIMSSPGFPELSANPVDHAGALGMLCGYGRHHFWSDDISFRDVVVDESSMTAAQITDLYLLALASAHRGKFATFDRRIPAHVIPGGVDALELISI